MGLIDRLKGAPAESVGVLDDDDERLKSVAIIPLGGGSIIGMEQAGIDTVAAAELNDAWPANVQLNRPKIPYVTELEEWTAWAESMREERPVLVHGIPPCQGFSGMSRTSGADNAKNQWLLHATRAATIIQPDFVMFENIPRALSLGRSVVNEMVEIARKGGYTVSVHRHDVQHFGVSQRRKRVLFIMEPKGKERAWPSHPHVEAPTAWEVISDLNEMEPLQELESGTPFVYASEAENEVQASLRNPEGYTFSHDLSPLPERYALVPQGKPWFAMPDEEMTDKERSRIEEGRLYNACETFRLHPEHVAGTITGARRFMHPYEERIISTREASRLMHYPDAWQWAKVKEWQQFAAGVCPPVFKWYGEVIQAMVSDKPLPVAEGRLFA